MSKEAGRRNGKEEWVEQGKGKRQKRRVEE